MNPDVAVGATMALICGVIFAAYYGTYWLIFTHPTVFEPLDESDDLAVARAVGVLVSAEGISSGQMAATIAWHATSRPMTVVDHVLCEGGCGRILCCCKPLHTAPRCSGTTEQVCGHNRPLCEPCAPGECFECLTEQLQNMRGGAW